MSRRRVDRDWNGVLPLDKPEGPTSHDLVARARRALGTRRVGHTGTLDPFASGLLLLCLGPSTRLAEYLSGLSKTYVATLRLGERTDTLDRTGETVARSDAWRELDEAQVRDALAAQQGEQLQVPPAYSAKKVGGERAYAAAREGRALELQPVPVTVHRVRVLRVALPEVEWEVKCSSGTYVRAIARDVGEALGVGAHLSALHRTRVGEHDVADALPADALDDEPRVRDALLAPAAAVRHLPRLEVDAAGEQALGHGQAVPGAPGLPAEGPVALVAGDGRLLAIGEPRGELVQPRKVFA